MSELVVECLKSKSVNRLRESRRLKGESDKIAAASHTSTCAGFVALLD